jgi:hypothetical protein
MYLGCVSPAGKIGETYEAYMSPSQNGLHPFPYPLE